MIERACQLFVYFAPRELNKSLFLCHITDNSTTKIGALTGLTGVSVCFFFVALYLGACRQSRTIQA